MSESVSVSVSVFVRVLVLLDLCTCVTACVPPPPPSQLRRLFRQRGAVAEDETEGNRPLPSALLHKVIGAGAHKRKREEAPSEE